MQAAIGAKGALAFDVTAACSGFVVGMVNGVHFIRGGEYKNVLVIGADVLSRYVDWRDRGTCILFGDGCGAMVLTAGPIVYSRHHHHVVHCRASIRLSGLKPHTISLEKAKQS